MPDVLNESTNNNQMMMTCFNNHHDYDSVTEDENLPGVFIDKISLNSRATTGFRVNEMAGETAYASNNPNRYFSLLGYDWK